MGAINGISGFNYYTNYPGIYSNPSDAAIAEKTSAQVRGIDQGTENLKDAQSVTRIADGAMEEVTEYLQRIRELALKSMNDAVYGADEKRMMQDEIDQLKQGIADIAGNTTFNEHQLLDGTKEGDFEIMAGGKGPTERVTPGNMTLESLGIKDFDVTKSFNLKDIDNALKTVSQQRGTQGAQSNRIDHAIAYNQLSSYNHVASFKEDDLGGELKKADEMHRNRVLETARIMMQKRQEEQQRQQTSNLFI
ncbi:MAG: hypothetical protein IJQ12_07505 [Lachnospiraceae bacterium]|nr:hypothetical protein [Lachnospiraceae bacterium]